MQKGISGVKIASFPCLLTKAPLIVAFWLSTGFFSLPAQTAVDESSASAIWEAGVAEGFKHVTQEAGLTLGPGFGLKVLGSSQAHDWVIATAQYGLIFSDILGRDSWYRGNIEVLLEVFGAYQYHPSHAYAVGVAPLLRYNFCVGHRLVPFFDFGAGGTATDIRDGDLSTTYEFNLQTGVGVHYFIRDDLAFTSQFRFLHLSNAGIDSPNLGVNTANILVGLTWFF